MAEPEKKDQTSQMMDLFTDMLEKAPVTVVKSNETILELAQDDKPRQDVNKLLEQIQSQYPAEEIVKNATKPFVTTAEYNEFKRQQKEAGMIDQMMARSGQFSLSQKSTQDGWRDKRALTAVIWLIGGSWSQIGIASNRAKETCVAAGHRALRDNRLEGLGKSRAARGSWLTQEQVSYLWKYGTVNQSLYLPTLDFFQLLKAMGELTLPQPDK